MRRLAKALGATLAVALFAAAPAQAEFGLKEFSLAFTNEDGSAARQAGSHPFEVSTTFNVKTRAPEEGEEEVPDGDVKELHFNLPAGFIGSTTAVPRCATVDFLTLDESNYPSCPNATAVGATQVQILHRGEPFNAPVYNLAPPPGVAAKIGFIVSENGLPVTVDVGVNGKAPNNIVAGLINIPQAVEFYGSSTQLWGIPAAHSHDPFRGKCLSPTPVDAYGEMVSKGICDTGAAEVPFLTLPRSCTGPLSSSYEALSWQNPDAAPDEGFSAAPGMTGCSKLGFSPQVTAKPTTSSAESASGLDFGIDINDEGLTNPTGLAQSEIEEVAVAMPAGMTLNPSAASGLAVCTNAEYEEESLTTPPAKGCPQASKIGELEVESPLLSEGETLKGSVFLASQDDNPFGTLLALYLVIENPKLGILVKQAGAVEPSEELGPEAGRILTFFEEVPQIPFSHLRFHFKEGARSPLITPPACGTYATEAELTPWAAPEEPLLTSATFDVTSGIGGGPCPPGGVPPFHPGFEAGSINNSAGGFSPFTMRLSRADGEQDMTRFSATLPPGLLASLVGLGKCPDAAIAAAKARTGAHGGREELARPSCPASSQIGRTLTGAGVGSILTYVPGSLYLAGPYNGAPLSVVAIVPGVAGPFDVGTVVVRVALRFNPQTAQAEADGAASDPIPHTLKGIPLKVRDIRVYADRPNWTFNPTSCDPSQTAATLFGGGADVFSAADDVPVDLSDRFQASSCASLAFKPNLAFKLKGGTKRGGHPALQATYTPRPGDANVKGLVVRLPHSAFLDQAHIRTICTRVQFAAKACPAASRYGFIKAFTPLLEEPLEGPVYLRSSNHNLPDLVFDLHGLVDVEVDTRIDSKNGGIRATIDSAPDAPLSKVLLTMQGQKKGLIVNSTNLCAGVHRADVRFTGQNGKGYGSRPVMRADCGGKQRRKRALRRP
jgi:hypothetical protein